jgi:hypothetical protein
MVHNFESEIEKIECNPAIRDCLKKLYASEEKGLSEPSKIPTPTYYENTIDEYYKQSNIRDTGEG